MDMEGRSHERTFGFPLLRGFHCRVNRFGRLAVQNGRTMTEMTITTISSVGTSFISR